MWFVATNEIRNISCQSGCQLSNQFRQSHLLPLPGDRREGRQSAIFKGGGERDVYEINTTCIHQYTFDAVALSMYIISISPASNWYKQSYVRFWDLTLPLTLPPTYVPLLCATYLRFQGYMTETMTKKSISCFSKYVFTQFLSRSRFWDLLLRI